MAERATHNCWVLGSNPTGPTICLVLKTGTKVIYIHFPQNNGLQTIGYIVQYLYTIEKDFLITFFKILQNFFVSS